jgi:hypothetical protein
VNSVLIKHDNYSKIQNGLKKGDTFFIAIAFQLCFGICHQEDPREPGRTEIEWITSASSYADDINILWENRCLAVM